MNSVASFPVVSLIKPIFYTVNQQSLSIHIIREDPRTGMNDATSETRESLDGNNAPDFFDRPNHPVELLKVAHIDAEVACGLPLLVGVGVRSCDVHIHQGDGGAEIGQDPFLSLQITRIWTR